MVWTPRVTVAAVAERGGRFLLVRERVDGRAVYNQPAGHLEAGESLVQAVVRETREETGWELEPNALVGVYRWQAPGGDTFVRFAFAGVPLRPVDDHPTDPDILDAVWLSAEELEDRHQTWRSPLVMCAVRDYLGGKLYPLDVLCELT